MSSDEAVEAAIERVAQSLMEAQYPPGTVQDGCLAPVWAEWVADPDPDAQSFVEAFRAMARPDPSILAAVRAEAVADERRRIRRQVADEIADRLEESSKAGVVGARHRDALLVAARIARAAGLVPPATPEPTCAARGCREPVGECCLDPVATRTNIVRPDGVAYTTAEVAEIFVEQQHSLTVATPPAEPAAQNYRRHLLSLDPSPEVRAALDEAIPAPSQPVTCEHGEPGRHALTRTNHPLPGCFTTTWCPGPVSVPKESSE